LNGKIEKAAQSNEHDRQAIMREAGSITSAFANAPRLARLLRYLVDESLADRADSLKESVIAIAVFDRGSDYDPQLDSVVRVHIGRLRLRLLEYYSTHDASVRIEIPKGNYAPIFTFAEQHEKEVEGETAWRGWRTAVVVVAALLVTGIIWYTTSSSQRPVMSAASIAVLPFLNMSGNASMDYMGDSIADEITGSLAESNDLRVVGRTSSFQYKGKGADIRKIGRELDASAVLEGSITGNDLAKLRILVQLIRTSDGYHLWSHAYETDSADLQRTEAEIARVAGEKLVPSAKLHLETLQSTSNSDAHDLYMRAIYAFHLRTVTAEREALRLAKESSAKDPKYVLPYLVVAQAELQLSTLLAESPRQAAANARDAIDRALALDPLNSDAHAEKALLAYTEDWDWPQAEREFLLALGHGSRAQAHNLYGWSLMTRGRFDDASAHLRIAAELDPQSLGPLLNQALNSIMRRDILSAGQRLDQVLQKNPNSFAALAMRTTVAVLQNDCKVALSYSTKLSETTSGLPIGELSGASVNSMCGHPEKARALAAKIRGGSLDGYLPAYSLAILYSTLGDREGVLESLRKSAEAHEPVILYLKVDPTWDRFRSDPLFQSLEHKVGLLN
jgi:TolB-like protein/Tfp pilus assembly protein PilF